MCPASSCSAPPATPVGWWRGNWCGPAPPPTLVGRSSQALTELVDELNEEAPGGRAAAFEVADIDRPASLRRLLHSPDDVVVSAVGPYARLGSVAVEAAIDAGCAYVDCAGEPAFIRQIFGVYGPKARRTGARLLTAMGYDFLPGNLAGSLLIERYREAGLRRVQVGYFVTGPFAASSGSVASAAGVMLDPSFAFRDGELFTERPVRKWPPSTSTALPRPGSPWADQSFSPCLGWIPNSPTWPSMSVGPGDGRAASAASTLAAGARQLPGVGTAVGAVFRTALGGASAEGPADHIRARSRSLVVADGFTADDQPLGRIRVEGPNPYDSPQRC